MAVILRTRDRLAAGPRCRFGRRKRRLHKLLFEPLENRWLLTGPEIAVFDRALDIPDGATVDFGVVPPNPNHGIEKTFTILNTGNASLELTLPSIMPPGFFITPPTAGLFRYTVQAGQQLTFDISMKDGTDRDLRGPISITTNDPDESPFDINLKGLITGNPSPNTVWIVDDGANGTGGFNAPNWTWDQTQGYLGDVHTIATSSSGGNQIASWEFRDLPTGVYRIWATWPTAGNRPTSVTYTVLDDQDSRGNRTANQRTAPNDLYADSVWWNELGDADIMNGILRVSVNAEGTTGNVLAADAFRIQRISDLTSIVEFTIDDGSAGFGVEGSGWNTSTGGYENDLRTNAAGSGADKARWTFNVSPGTYEVWATWYPQAGISEAANAPFTVFDDQTERGTVLVDQRVAPDDFHDGWNWWESLGGPYEITSLSTHALVVELTDNAGGTVIADALRVKRILLPAPVAGPEIEVRSGATSLSDGGTLGFGSTPPGEAVQKTLTVRNVGSDPLDLTSLSGLPNGFSVTPPFAAATLEPGESVNYTLSLQSDTPGAYHGTLSLGSTDGDENPFDVVLDGRVETTAGPDVELYLVSKGRWFAQTGTGTPQLGDETPYFFYSLVAEAPNGSATVNSATVSPPGKSAKTLVRNDFEQSWEYEADFASKSSLDSNFAKGIYRFSIDAVNDGTQTPTLMLPADAYPPAPRVTDWTEAQSLIPTADFPITWDAFAGGTIDDFIQLCAYGSGYQEVFCTPDPGEPGALDGTVTSAVIPANTLAGNQSYAAALIFVNVVEQNTTGYPGAVGVAAYVTQTEFAIQTVIPPPPQGALQFSAAAYRAGERDGQVTVTVTRSGGTQGEVQVHYATSDGTAASGADYEAAEDTLTFADGVATQTFSVTLLNDDLVEGDETVDLTLSDPTGGAVLGTTATAILTIADDEVTVGPGTYTDSDGDSYTIKLRGPGTARIRLDDPDGDGRGPIESILLTGTSTKSSLSITVKKAASGDGKVPIGQITGDGDLKSLSVGKSDLTGAGLAFAGWVGKITLGDLNNLGTTSNIVLGGNSAQSTKITLGNVADGSSIELGTTLGSLTARSLGAVSLRAPAISKLSTTAGPLRVDLEVLGAAKSISVKGGGAGGRWQAASFSKISISGGGFEGDLVSTATAASLGKTAAIGKLTVSGGDFTGHLHALGIVGSVKVTKDKSGAGGTMVETHAAAASFGTFSISKDLQDSVVLAGANLGDDWQLGGTGTAADTFGTGAIKKFSVGGQVQHSIVGAGLDPVGMVFRNGNDEIVGVTASKIGSFSIAGAAGAENYFRAGAWPKKVKIGGTSVNPLTDPPFLDLQNFWDYGSTGEDGRVVLQIAGKQLPLQLLDGLSGQPIPGLQVAVSTGTGTEGLAVLEVFDPTDQYPPRFVVLHGTQAAGEPEGLSATFVAAAEAEGEDEEYAVKVFERTALGGETVEALQLAEHLPALKAPLNVVSTVNGALEAFGKLAKLTDKGSGGLVTKQLEKWDAAAPQPISNQDALHEINEKARQDVLKNLALAGVASIVTGNPLPLLGFGISLGATELMRMMDEDTVIQCPEGQLYVTRLGNTELYSCSALPAIPPLTPAPVIATSEGSPVSGGYIEMISQHRLGLGLRAPLDGNGHADVEVPAGDYTFQHVEQGRPPYHTDVTIPPEGTSVNIDLPPKSQVASLTLNATPAITGLLDPGTEIRFTVEAKNAAGQVIPLDQLPCTLSYQVHNPVGSQVADIVGPQDDLITGPGTGVLTVGPDQGAARVVAACGAVKSNLKLVSGLGPAFLLPVIVISDASAEEGNSGTRNCVFNVALDRASEETVTVDYNTAYIGSASPATDYTDVTGRLTFSPGVTARQILVPVRGDLLFEGDEEFAVGLSNPVSARLDLKNSARGTILDDDAPGLTVSPTAGLVTTEAGGRASFSIKLNSQPTADVTVTLASNDTSEGTVSPTSLTFTSSNWSTARTVTVTGVDDTQIDGDIPYQVMMTDVTSDDPDYADPALLKPTVGVTNRDNDTLGPGKIWVTALGNGYVTDNKTPHRIDTSVGKEIGSYTQNDFPILEAFTPSGGMAYPDWICEPDFAWCHYGFNSLVMTGPEYANGLHVTAIFSSLHAAAAFVGPVRPPTPDDPSPAASDDEAISRLLSQAAAAWEAVGLSERQSSEVRNVPVDFVDLPGLFLGAADRSVIYLDSDAAGYGWYVDATPEEHGEFTRTSAMSFRAPNTSPAAGRMDLLTVLTHELGHLLGLEDLDPVQAADGIMAGVLQPSVRRLPWSAAVDAVFFGQG